MESPDGGLGAVRELDSGTPEAECQWWADRLGDEWGWLAHPRFSLLWMRLRSLGGFSPRVRTVRLRGGVAQLSPEEDPRTFAEEGLPCSHVVMVCYSYCKPAGSRRWRRGKGGWGSKTNPPPPPPPTRRCWCRVVAAAAAAAMTMTSSLPLGSPTSSSMGEAVRMADRPGGRTGVGAITRAGRSVRAAWGCPPWRHSKGTWPQSYPGVARLQPGTTVVQRRISEDYEEALLLKLASG